MLHKVFLRLDAIKRKGYGKQEVIIYAYGTTVSSSVKYKAGIRYSIRI